jgi:hypothetical protein
VAQDTGKEKDKMLEDHQEVEQDNVQVVQSPYCPNVIDFENKKMLIRSDKTESAKEKNIIIDDNASLRMIKPINSEVGLQKVNERKRKSAPRPKPTVEQLLDKNTSHKANNVFSRLGRAKGIRSPSRSRGHKCERESLYN